MDDDKQYFQASVGTDLKETDIIDSFCIHCIERGDQIFIVEDTTKSELFKDNVFVLNEPFIRFYAGAPLKTTKGVLVGTLCVFDVKPRTLESHQIDALKVLSDNVMHLMEMRQANLVQKELLKESNANLRDALDRLIEAQRTF